MPDEVVADLALPVHVVGPGRLAERAVCLTSRQVQEPAGLGIGERRGVRSLDDGEDRAACTRGEAEHHEQRRGERGTAQQSPPCDPRVEPEVAAPVGAGAPRQQSPPGGPERALGAWQVAEFEQGAAPGIVRGQVPDGPGRRSGSRCGTGAPGPRPSLLARIRSRRRKPRGSLMRRPSWREGP